MQRHWQQIIFTCHLREALSKSVHSRNAYLWFTPENMARSLLLCCPCVTSCLQADVNCASCLVGTSSPFTTHMQVRLTTSTWPEGVWLGVWLFSFVFLAFWRTNSLSIDHAPSSNCEVWDPGRTNRVEVMCFKGDNCWVRVGKEAVEAATVLQLLL